MAGPVDMGRWGEEYEEEGESLDNRKVKASPDEMIPVGADNWKQQVQEKILDITGIRVNDGSLRSIEKASKATCSVSRVRNSQQRIAFHEGLAEKGNPAEKKYHARKAANARKGLPGFGTGLLLEPSPIGHLVITTNHIIMGNEEAKDATVTFDYLRDNRRDQRRAYRVRKVFTLRTEEAADTSTYDFSILILAAEDNDPFLRERGVHWEERVYEKALIKACLKMTRLQALPLIMISHPLNLAMRIGIGRFPDESLASLKHNIPSQPGCSGANLLFSYDGLTKASFNVWGATFLHYSHGLAVSWHAIAPLLRNEIERK